MKRIFHRINEKTKEILHLVLVIALIAMVAVVTLYMAKNSPGIERIVFSCYVIIYGLSALLVSIVYIIPNLTLIVRAIVFSKFPEIDYYQQEHNKIITSAIGGVLNIFIYLAIFSSFGILFLLLT